MVDRLGEVEGLKTGDDLEHKNGISNYQVHGKKTNKI